jgi:hypothetical protein
MTSTKMRFFWLLLSMMKCSGVPFTHIFEWKRCSPYFISYGSPGWSLVVATVVLGSTSMIRHPLSGSDSESEPTCDLEAFTSDSDKEIYFPYFLCPFFCGLGLPFPSFFCEGFLGPNCPIFCLSLFSILTPYR